MPSLISIADVIDAIDGPVTVTACSPDEGSQCEQYSKCNVRDPLWRVREKILTALFVPALSLARDPERGGTNFLRLLGRAYADPAPLIRQFLSSQYAQMIARFKSAFASALPNLPRKELSWRLHFIMGALSYTLAGTDALKLIAELNPHETDNDEILLRRLAHRAARRPRADSA